MLIEQGSLGNNLLDLVPPIHSLPPQSPQRHHPTQRIHRHRQRDLPLAPIPPTETRQDNASDPLLNPCHLLIGAKTRNEDVAKTFAEWLVSTKGQAVVREFKA
jgi:hypothetical protein